MTATDLAVVVIAIAALALAGVTVAMIMILRQTTDELTELVERLRTDIAHAMDGLDVRAGEIEAELQRVDGLVETAERVTARAETLSKMTYGAVAKPVIKTAAVVKGTGRAARRLRGRDVDEATG